MRWPYVRRIDPAHAWGVVAVGTAGVIAIPTVLATLNATDAQFRWWWPTNWMAVPAVIFVLGLGLAAVPIRKNKRTDSADAGASDMRDSHPSTTDAPKENEMLEGRGMAGPRQLARESSGAVGPAGHAFISYVREDSERVDELQRDLESAGVSVWRDTANLWPGEDWRRKIRHAITEDALVFIACFSSRSAARAKSYQNEEITLAVEQLRLRRPDMPWLIPVRFDDCLVPDMDIGGGRTLAYLHSADLFGDERDAVAARLVATASRILTNEPLQQDLTSHSGESEIASPLEESAGESEPEVDTLSSRFGAHWAGDISLFAKIKQQPSFEDVEAAIKRGSELNLISKHGIRAPLETTSIYLRIPHPDQWSEECTIPLCLEQRWMDPIAVCEWRRDKSLVDIFFDIAMEMRAKGCWEGEQNYNPQATFEQIADLLLYGIQTIRTGNNGAINRLFQIVADDWVITEWEMIDKRHHYQITFRRLNEVDWIPHMLEKPWVDNNVFLEAFGYAEMLIYNGTFEGNLPQDWKVPSVWPFKTMLDG